MFVYQRRNFSDTVSPKLSFQATSCYFYSSPDTLFSMDGITVKTDTISVYFQGLEKSSKLLEPGSRFILGC